jgi:hypothetical protein
MDSLQAFFRDVESAAFWHRVAPWLHVGAREGAGGAQDDGAQPVVPPPVWAEPWRSAGYLRIDAILDAPRLYALVRAMHSLRAHHIHPTFLYVFDETWDIADALFPWLSTLLGDDFDVLADAWAWHIDPRSDRGGWPIHRGWYEDVRDATGTAALVNVWVALTDASERNACMHVVPLSRDPHYPGDLHDVTALEDHALALPAAAGTALVWNANVAHWGGTCDPSFDQPRISVSFTARRRGGPTANLRGLQFPLTFAQRLDLIAEQFERYAAVEQLAPDRVELRWATLVNGMRAAARRSAASRQG